jgi:tetratricopeptide (TPR) repeat protein
MNAHLDQAGGGCPNADDLFAFAVGRLPAGDRETISSHIENCPACLGLLEKFNGQDDPLLAELRQPLPPDLFSRGQAARTMHLPEGATGNGTGMFPVSAKPEATGLPEVPGYWLLEELGRGGMGVVYRAWQLELNRLVALKMIRAGVYARAEDLARFRAEAEAVAQLQHPNIVQIYHVGEQAGLPFFALEYLEGGSLQGKVRESALPAAEAARLVQTLAEAMQAAHERGIVHRDLKPANVLLDRYGRPKITDFGLARRIEGGPGLTGTDAYLGTPSYMAPEQAAGKGREAGPAADVYGLGATLYELLTGRPPFKAATAFETMNQVLHEEPVPPRRLQPGVPRDLETICLKCLHKDSQKRYASARALAEDLRRFLGGEAIVARPVGMVERGWKWIRRHPAAAALVGVAILLLVGGLTGVLWYARHEQLQAERERALRREADDQRQQARDVLRFFEDRVLAAARPRSQAGGLGREATIRAAVEVVEPTIAGAFRDRPRVEAAIRNTIGLTWWYLGEYPAAIGQHERALELRLEEFGPDDPDTLASSNNLALACLDAGQLHRALPLFEQTLAKRQEQLGPDHPDTLTSMLNVALAYKADGQLPRALPLLEQTLAKRQERLGPDDPDTLNCMNCLGNAYRAANQLDKALPLLEQTLAKQKEQLPPDHPATLASLNNLATTYHAAGRFAKAVPLFRELLAKCQEQLGPTHPNTLRSTYNLASAYQAAGQLDQALPLFEQAFAKSKEKLAPDHPVRLTSTRNLAGAYLAAGRPKEAIPLFEEVLATRQKLSPTHPLTLTSMNELAVAWLATRQTDRAVRLLEQTVAAQRKNPGPDDPDTLVSLHNLARAYRAAGQLDRAVPLFEQALAKHQEKRGPGHPFTLLCLNSLAEAYQQQGHFAQAERLLRQSLTLRQQKQPDAWTTFDTESLLGASLLGQGEYAQAEPLLLKGYEGMKARAGAIPGGDRKRLAEALDRLVQLYEAWGQPDKADEWRKRRERELTAADPNR